MLDRALLIDHASFYDPVIGNRAVYSPTEGGEDLEHDRSRIYPLLRAFPDDSLGANEERIVLI